MTINLTSLDGFVPLSERIILKPDRPVEQIGHIILPESVQQPAQRAQVIKMGPGMLTKSGGRWPMPDIKPGDYVLYDPRVHDYCQKFKVNGEEYIVVFPERVLAVEEPDASAAK
jgi:co-chaperonin GroES (HSP10)